jgi:hypothetical protein
MLERRPVFRNQSVVAIGKYTITKTTRSPVTDLFDLYLLRLELERDTA